jgi:hypothetical protein
MIAEIRTVEQHTLLTIVIKNIKMYDFASISESIRKKLKKFK